MTNDEYVSQLRESLSVMADDLYWTDEHGSKHYDGEAVKDLATAVGEILRDQLRDLHLPPISGQEGKRYYAFKNIHINAALPDKIKFNLETIIDMSNSYGTEKPMTTMTKKKKKLHTELYLTTSMKRISAKARDIEFAVEHPKFKEDGVMDVEIPAANLAIDFIFSPTKTSTQTSYGTERTSSRYKFVRARSYCSVSDIIINYHKETLDHRFLVPFATRLFKSYIIRNFEAGIERALNEKLTMLGDRIEKILERNPLL
jgi:hypothetical protein